MMLDWNEWQCPYCKRINEVDEQRMFEFGEALDRECSTCGRTAYIAAVPTLSFFAYSKPEWRDDACREVKEADDD